MNRFILETSELEELKAYDSCANDTNVRYAYSYCPGCSDSGCTGSAQYGCKSCSSCAAWRKGHGA